MRLQRVIHLLWFDLIIQLSSALQPNQPDHPRWWHVEVSDSYDTPSLYAAASDEPLLLLAERAGLNPPSECLRGNCLSCAARLAPGSSLNFRTDETFLCNDARARGFLLTCSSYATGPGLKIELDKNHEVAEIQYYERFTGQARTEGRVASAQQSALWAMTHQEEWRDAVSNGDSFNPVMDLEKVLLRSDEGPASTKGAADSSTDDITTDDTEA